MTRPVPKYLKKEYTLHIQSYKDIPGWINDAEYLYELAVKQGKDGDLFVEIGTLLGQSTARMATLISESGKSIRFDSIDIFYNIQEVVKASHPPEFSQYLNLFSEYNTDILQIIKHPLNQLNVEDLVNFVVCDEKYAHNIYENSSISFLWIDGDHSYKTVYEDLLKFWPKIKPGGMLAGDDIVYSEVLEAVEDFGKEIEEDIVYNWANSTDHRAISGCYNSFYIIKRNDKNR